MNAATRTRIRTAIDQHARARRQAFIDAFELDVCVGCGGDLNDTSAGCKTCHDRKRRRLKPRPTTGRPPLVRCLHCKRRTRSQDRLCLTHRSVSLPSRPAGHLESVANRSKSPVGRTPSQVECMVVSDRAIEGGKRV